jgi:hypothetical protein
MSLYKSFKADSTLEKTGVALLYGTNSKGASIEITIARAGGANKQYSKTLEHKTKPYRRMIQAGTMDQKVGEQIMREVYAETVILGWKNVEDEDGNELEFTKENVVKVLNDLPDLFRDIQEQANSLAVFRQESLDEEAKN